MAKPFTMMGAVLFFVVAIAHVLRLVYGWQVTVGDAFIPMWVSAVAAVITAGLAFLLWREAKK